MKVLFIGSTERGYLTLRNLLAHNIPVCGAISLEQHAHEKKRFENDFIQICKKHDVPLVETKKITLDTHFALIKDKFKPDIIIVVGCRHIIPKEIITMPLRGSFAVHDSLLPKYRGFAATNWAIINGENVCGVTLFSIDEGMDTGDIILQTKIRIDADDDAGSVFKKVCQASMEIVVDGYRAIVEDRVKPIKQNEGEATYTCSRNPADGKIKWSEPTHKIWNLIRGLSDPFPGAFAYYRQEKIFIRKAIPSPEQRNYVGRIPGRIVHVDKSSGFVEVLTSDGILRLLEVMAVDKAPTAPANIISSVRESLD